jgi:paxillin
MITALNRNWHPEHFLCELCERRVGEDGYHEKDSHAYCRECYMNNFVPKCLGCKQIIVDTYIQALGGHYHKNCFVCQECSQPFLTGSFYEHDHQPLCELHYHQRRGSLCSSCQKPIGGRCITAMGRKYHIEHFICSYCTRQLQNGTFKEYQNKPYCHPCFVKLFA